MTPLIATIRTFAVTAAAVALSFWLGAPAVAAAQHGPRTVFGQVRSADGRPVAQAQVAAWYAQERWQPPMGDYVTLGPHL